MKKEVEVKVSTVLEARPLAELVGIANKFESRILITMDTRTINAKSIMGMMGLGLDTDKKIVIEAEGPDEQEAIQAIEAFLVS